MLRNTLDPDSDFWLDPDPDSMNMDPKHCSKQCVTGKENSRICTYRYMVHSYKKLFLSCKLFPKSYSIPSYIYRYSLFFLVSSFSFKWPQQLTYKQIELEAAGRSWTQVSQLSLLHPTLPTRHHRQDKVGNLTADSAHFLFALEKFYVCEDDWLIASFQRGRWGEVKYAKWRSAAKGGSGCWGE